MLRSALGLDDYAGVGAHHIVGSDGGTLDPDGAHVVVEHGAVICDGCGGGFQAPRLDLTFHGTGDPTSSALLECPHCHAKIRVTGVDDPSVPADQAHWLVAAQLDRPAGRASGTGWPRLQAGEVTITAGAEAAAPAVSPPAARRRRGRWAALLAVVVLFALGIAGAVVAARDERLSILLAAVALLAVGVLATIGLALRGRRRGLGLLAIALGVGVAAAALVPATSAVLRCRSISANANLSSCSLAGKDLSGRDLTGANLRGADLSNASLRSASLSKADLTNADLSGARLDGATLTGATVHGGDFTGASLAAANLAGLRLVGANLTRIRASHVNLAAANLDGVPLAHAQLRNAAMGGAILDGANLSGATLAGAKLANASFRGAKLTGAALAGATLETNDFTGAVGLSDTQLSQALGVRRAGLAAAVVRHGLVLEDPAAVRAAVSGVPAGGAVPGTHPYRASAGFHPLEVLTTGGGAPVGRAVDGARGAWAPPALRFTELIVSARTSRTAVETCQYDVHPITRYARVLTVDVYAAASGRLVSTRTFQGPPPRQCQFTELVSTYSLVGSAVNARRAVVPWLARFVHPVSSAHSGGATRGGSTGGGATGGGATVGRTGWAGVWRDPDTTDLVTVRLVGGVPVVVSVVDSTDNEAYVVRRSMWNGSSLSWTYHVPSTGYTVSYRCTSHTAAEMRCSWSNDHGARGTPVLRRTTAGGGG